MDKQETIDHLHRTADLLSKALINTQYELVTYGSVSRLQLGVNRRVLQRWEEFHAEIAKG